MKADAAAGAVRSHNISYLLGIDHLRAFAAVLVVLYHGTQLFHWQNLARRGLGHPSWPRVSDPFSALIIEGHTAVALFMVLSGFIFAYGAGSQRIHYARFLWNRLLRTYPLFIAVIVVGACTMPAAVSLERVLHTVLGLASFWTQGLQLMPFSGVFWTIGIEWQFYLLFPLLLAFLRQSMLKHLLALLTFVFLCRCLALLNGADFRDLAYWTLLGRIDQFLLGIAAGFYFRRLPDTFKRLLFLPAVAVTLGSLLWFNHKGGWPVSLPFRALWCTWEGLMWAAVCVSYLSLANGLPRLISTPICRVGVASYSVYLWHFPILTVMASKGWFLPLLQDSQQNAFLNTLLCVLPPVVAFSGLSYYLIERPFLAFQVRYLSAD